MRRILGAALVTWATYRLLDEVAARQHAVQDLDRIAADWWPALLIVAALLGAARTLAPASTLRGPAILALLGAFGLMITTDWLDRPSPWTLAASLAVMIIGLLMLTARQRIPSQSESEAYPVFRAAGAVRQFSCTSTRLTHGRALAVLGGLRVDLRKATTARVKDVAWSEEYNGHGAVLDVTAIGATVEIHVPPTWWIEVTQPPLTRPVRVELPNDVPAAELTGRLKLNVLTVGADVTVKA